MFKRELQLTSIHRDSEVTKKATRGGRLAEVAAWHIVILRFEQEAFRGPERT